MLSKFYRVSRLSSAINSTYFGATGRKYARGYFRRGGANPAFIAKGVIAVVLAALVAAPLSPAQANILGEVARDAAGRARVIASEYTNSDTLAPTAQESPSVTQADDPGSAKSRVHHFKLCPRRLVLYVGEAYTLVPTPVDGNREAVNAVQMQWDSNDRNIADVSSWGEVSAISAGHTVVRVQAGSARATVSVEVREGGRRRQSDLESDLEHSGDCSDPEAAQLKDTEDGLAEVLPTRTTYPVNAADGHRLESPLRDVRDESDDVPMSGTMKRALKPAMLRVSRSQVQRSSYAMKATAIAAAAAGKKFFGRGLYLIDPIDGSGGDPSSPAAAAPNNAVGTYRFGAQESAQGPTKTKRLLGSYDFVFSAPVLSLGGRGLGTDLALTYNSRLWNKDTAGMTFNYNKGWPSAGWTLGYGRVIQNYDGTATGDQSGVGSLNASGNYLLIAPDGSRTHLQQSYDSVSGIWKHDSTDGSFLHLNDANGKLKYPDGTIVKYNLINNRLLPASIETHNGDLITIAYRTKTSSFKYRWAIDQITDSLGRIIQFHYYGDTGYPADDANGKPTNALATITTPAFGSGTRTLAQLDYQNITLQYNFSVPVDQNNNPATGSTLTVVRRIYYPATGTGYLFPDYSSYGMARYISIRNQMTGAGGTVTDGTEIAYTKYDYVDVNSQIGQLNDSPQYTHRSEWWQAKTDANGNPDSTPTVYTYARSFGTGTEIDTVSYPNDLDIVTTTDNNSSSTSFGRVLDVQQKKRSTGAVLQEVSFSYLFPSDGGIQIDTVTNWDDLPNKSKVSYTYGSYGRLSNMYEYGFKVGSFNVKRRTQYSYSDDTNLLGANMYRLVTEVDVYDALQDSDDTNDVLKSKTVLTYDNYEIKGGLEYYGLASGTFPPNHDATYDQNKTVRGNVTGVQTFSSISPSVSTTRYSKYDIFGNVVQADVSCCQVKNSSFNSSNYYSQPVSVTSGTSGVVPFLTTNYQYDFNTGMATQLTDPSNLTNSVTYDAAWRVYQVNTASGAYKTTSFDKDANSNDLLSYTEQVNYSENGSSKVTTNRSWLDGGGRAVKAGTGAGASPTSFDMVATVYDSLGRTAKQSNPYAGDGSGNGTPSYWTANTYDELSRVTVVMLPDGQTVQTAYSGATTTVTDQVGRKRQGEVDGLGRLIKVTEQNPATGLLDPTNYLTAYSYDVLDNLTQVNQGNQLRSFSFDALSRLTSQTTPEGGTVSFTYTDSNDILKRVDARNVETHYKYDTLSRPIQTWYTGLGGDDAGTVRPALPSGIGATPDVTISYNNFSISQAGNGQVSSLTDGGGSETYAYDTLARLSSKSRVIDGQSYQTQYLYNTANQMTTLIYPSGKRVRTNHDSRGRMSGLDRVDSSGNMLSQYITTVGYNTASQVTSVGLANGVSETYGFDPQRMQLTSQTVTKGSTLMSLTYGYAASAGASGVNTTAGNTGQLMAISGTVNAGSRSQAFTYDNLTRISTASGWSTWGRRYAYDRWGNLTGMWDAVTGGNQIQNIAIATTAGVANNKIANVNLVNYTYDASGNCTNDGGHNYTYDGEGRQVSVDNGATSTSTYDAYNWRVKTVAGGVTTHCVWEGSQVIAEYNGSTGALISEFIFAGSKMVARDQGGVLRYYHQDRLSTRLITDGSGSVMGTEDHLPFGEDAGTTGETEKHRFTNYERDSESGSDYAVNRQHSFGTGRFMQADPFDGSYDAFDPQSLNRYTYAGNDPVNFADPLGLFSVCFWNIQQIRVPESREHPSGTMDVLVFEGCVDFGDIGSVGGIGGGGGGDRQPQKQQQQQKKKCKQDQTGGDRSDIELLLGRAGLTDLIQNIRQSSKSPEGITFDITNRDAFVDRLKANPAFKFNTIFNGSHVNDVGKPAIDSRSFTTKDGLGPDSNGINRSLQVAVGPPGTIPGQPNAARGYADLDCNNPAQDLVSLLKHGAPNVFRRIGRVFR